MKLYKTKHGPVVEDSGIFYRSAESDWDRLLNRDNLSNALVAIVRQGDACKEFNAQTETLAPIGQQEVWAAGVTYYRSRTARIEESKTGGGSDFYDRVYSAVRPELFFKATPSR